jgi:hypothetical protein
MLPRPCGGGGGFWLGAPIQDTDMKRFKKYLARVSATLFLVGFPLFMLWGVMDNGSDRGLSKYLLNVSLPLLAVAAVGGQLWGLLYLFTLVVRFFGWLFEDRGTYLGRRIGGIVIAACVLVPGEILVELLLPYLLPKYMEPVTWFGFHWKIFGIILACIGLGPLVGRFLGSIEAGKESLHQRLFSDED